MATQPVLGGTTLAYVSEYEEERFLKGASAEMADGSIVVDVLGAGAAYRKRFKLGWKAISSANADTIQTQYWAMVAAGSAAFTSPKNTTHTVQPTKDVSCSQKAVKKNSTTLLYDIDFTVEEVT